MPGGTYVDEGSSPLMRGKLVEVTEGHGVHGLIPAHAGKTDPRDPLPHRRRAHPRSHGENRAEKAHPAFQKGSSPLTQGKHLVASARHTVEGLIPTHAGKTSSCGPAPGP